MIPGSFCSMTATEPLYLYILIPPMYFNYAFTEFCLADFGLFIIFKRNFSSEHVLQKFEFLSCNCQISPSRFLHGNYFFKVVFNLLVLQNLQIEYDFLSHYWVYVTLSILFIYFAVGSFKRWRYMGLEKWRCVLGG